VKSIEGSFAFDWDEHAVTAHHRRRAGRQVKVCRIRLLHMSEERSDGRRIYLVHAPSIDGMGPSVNGWRRITPMPAM
jgi:hypothetical protein